MFTECVRCIPTTDVLDSMHSAGCTFRVDGKQISKSKVSDIVTAEATLTKTKDKYTSKRLF